MKKLNGLLLHKGAFLLLVIALLASCVPQKRIRYFQQISELDSTHVFDYAQQKEYRVKPGDNLYINVSSLDSKTFEFFNTSKGTNNSGNYYNEAGIYLNSYTVSDSGNIDFPFIGKIYVQELNTAQITKKLQDVIDEYLIETTVVVKLVNFKITFIGEVKQPGQLQIYQDKINIFEAIAKAGDLTDFANRNEVKLIRKEEGRAVIYDIDLTKRDILASDLYYLQPNDIIYVEPLRGKQFTFANFPYAIVFSMISTTILLLNYFD